MLKMRSVPILAARDEDRPGDDRNAAGEHAGGQGLAEEQPAPQHAEGRDEERHRERARRADVGDQAKVDEERERAREQRQGEDTADDERRGDRGIERRVRLQAAGLRHQRGAGK